MDQLKKLNSNLPKNLSDGTAVIFLLVAVITTFVFEIQVVLPQIHEIDVTIQYFHTTIGLFILFNIFSNLFMLIITDNSTSGLLLPSTLKLNWRFCPSCEANSPPRSYHCHICDKCILKRDHHCVFSGCCIGYKNFRYYYGLLIYISIGGFYASVLNQLFIWKPLGGLSLISICYHILPFPFWLFGSISLKVMFWTFISIIDICGFLFAGCLLYFHGNLLINNQTTFERNKKNNTYNLGFWKTNVEESLGPNWLAALLFSPLVKSPLPRNGLDFPTFKEKTLHLNKSK